VKPPADPIDRSWPEALGRAEAYPHDPDAGTGIERIQTHLSWVYLTAERVYKFRKDVDVGFVDFSTRASRRRDCLDEVRLNRRLAPDVYLGVAEARIVDGALRVGEVGEEFSGPEGEDAEPCVVMRRLPDGRDALSLLDRGDLTPGQIDVLAARIARFHGEHALVQAIDDEAWARRICGPVHDNFEALSAFPEAIVPRAALARMQRRNAAFEQTRLPRLLSRVRSGHAVDGHGDLHLQHVWYEAGSAEPRIIDCLEFDEELRQFDTACDVAFLAMDLRYRGRAGWAERLLRRYARDADDFGLYAVVDYYAAYRAAVRAKVAAIASQDERVSRQQRAASGPSARRHVLLADRLLEARAPGPLIAVCGIVGAGKTTVAELIADELRGAVVCADRVRKRSAGLDPLASARAAPDAGLYTPDQRARTYTALLERARDVVGSGRVAVLDATFSETAERDRCRAWAREHGVTALLVQVECDRAVALRRLEARRTRGGDASDAGPELHARSAERFEKPTEWPGELHMRVDTSRRGWRRDARAAVRRLAAGKGSA